MESQAVVDENPFAPAENAFAELRDRLGTADSMQLTHAEVESLIEQDGREILRQLFQAHLTLRATQEVVHPAVTGADGVTRGQCRHTSRQLETLFGTVRVERASYGARRCPSLKPMDAHLNLPPTRCSDGVECRIAESSAKESFDEVVETVRKTTGAAVAKRQLEEAVVRAASDFDAFYEQQPSERPQRGSLVVLSFDGKGVVMRKEHLREPTAQAQTRRSFKLGKRLSKGEKKNARRMATVAALYEIQPYVRTPEQIVREMQPVHEVVPPRPRPQNKRVSASLEKPPEQVVADYFDAALRRDPTKRRPWVVLVDGAETQLGLVLGCAEAAKVDVVVVLDIIHVIEYLWKAALCFHAEGSAAAERWVSERLLEVLRGRARHVAAGMRRSATKRSLSQAKRKNVDKCANYFLSHQQFMKYDEYVAAGFPIATGVIEGACRYLVKDRMDITGARWGLDGAEAVLKLRALRASGDFEAYWTFRQNEQYRRNHAMRYARGRPPDIANNPSRRRKHLRVVT